MPLLLPGDSVTICSKWCRSGARTVTWNASFQLWLPSQSVSVNGTSRWSGTFAGTVIRNGVTGSPVAPAPITPYVPSPFTSVTNGSAVEAVANTGPFVEAPPRFRSATRRSTVSPASANPSPLPLVPPALSSSTLTAASETAAAAAAVTLSVVWNGFALYAVTVSVNAPV